MKRKRNSLLHRCAALVLATQLLTPVTPLLASSHQDAPLIILDPSANTTDVYAFVNTDGTNKTLVVALGVYPHEEPGVGPNKYNFDPGVLYEIHVALGSDVAAGRKTISYQFQFTTTYRNQNTILQSYIGVVTNVADGGQNLIQNYTVTKVEQGRRQRRTTLGTGVVPPNNQGNATPFYNQGDNGENLAKLGVATEGDLDRYTAQAVTNLSNGYVAFAGQRDDGFYGDIQSIFDLLSLRNPGKDSQGGFNLHLMALEIPVSELGGDQQIVGVYATTSRQQVRVLRKENQNHRGQGQSNQGDRNNGAWVQVARQGNPLFNEGLVAIVDKDKYSRSSPTSDSSLFRKYAETPELAALINTILLGGASPGITTGRTDIAGIFIPDLIKVDLSTDRARLAGGGPGHPTNPDDAGFSRLSIFGGDVLTSAVQPGFGGGTIPGGWPNGRRFGDDVVDIAINALISDLRVSPPVINTFPPGDGVFANDMTFNKVFPYESTPQNGRNHSHP